MEAPQAAGTELVVQSLDRHAMLVRQLYRGIDRIEDGALRCLPRMGGGDRPKTAEANPSARRFIQGPAASGYASR